MRKTSNDAHSRFSAFAAFAAALLAASAADAAVAWRNLDPDHHLAGRKTSEGYLRGKVVLVDRWGLGCPPCRRMLPIVEERIWHSFRNKPFVAVGGHCIGWGDKQGVRSFAKSLKITYPIYEDAGLAEGEPHFEAIPFMYVVDETGKVVYKGHDDRNAMQAVVVALTDMESPKDLADWRRFLDWEIENLPGRAWLRLDEFRKKHPQAAKEYVAKAKALAAVPGIRKLAELVDFAKKAKDAPEFTAKQKTQRDRFAKAVRDAAAGRKYADLLESKDPRVVQEAKNALADLKWKAAEL